jgi:hypothetical protein
MDPAHENHSKSLSAVAAAWQALAPLMDLVTPMALRMAATLRLADEMPDQDNGAIPASELARRAGANADALTRLLRHLVQYGVFSEPQPGEFAVNQTAALLRADHPAAMRTWTGSAAGWTWRSPASRTPCALVSPPGPGVRAAVLAVPGR